MNEWRFMPRFCIVTGLRRTCANEMNYVTNHTPIWCRTDRPTCCSDIHATKTLPFPLCPPHTHTHPPRFNGEMPRAHRNLHIAAPRSCRFSILSNTHAVINISTSSMGIRRGRKKIQAAPVCIVPMATMSGH